MKDVTEFETVSNEIMDAPDDGNLRENVVYWLKNDRLATVNFTQGKYVTKIKKLAEKFPDRVRIMSEKDGVIVATVPRNAIKVSIVDTKNRKLSGEQIERRRVTLEKARMASVVAKRQNADGI